MKISLPKKSRKRKNIKKKFACLEVTEDFIKIVYFDTDAGALKLTSVSILNIINEKDISLRIQKALGLLDKKYKDVVISLPRKLVTIRSTKFPSQDENEIKNMVSLQATKYLPYKKEELIAGYQVISYEKGGYSRLFLILLHKNNIEEYVKECGKRRVNVEGIFVSSFGLFSWFKAIYGGVETKEPVLVLEVDTRGIDLIVTDGTRLLFTRSFNSTFDNESSKAVFIDDIRVTLESYSRESIGAYPKDIILTGVSSNLIKLKEVIASNLGFQVKIIESFDIPRNLMGTSKIESDKFDVSFSHLIGMGLGDFHWTSNLIAESIKTREASSLKKKELVSLGVYIFAFFLIVAAFIYRTVSSKLEFLHQLQNSYKEIAVVAKDLKNKESKIAVVKNNFFSKPTSVDLIFELYKIIPADVKLENLSLNRNQQIVLKGYTRLLSNVNKLMSILNSSELFYDIKLDYATKKGKPPNDFAVFRVLCPFKNHDKD